MEKTEPLQQLIQQAREKLKELEAKRTEALIELRAYEKALSAIQPKTFTSVNSELFPLASKEALQRSGRKISSTLWTEVLEKMVNSYPKTFTYNDLNEIIIGQKGLPMDTRRLRSQMFQYVNSKIVERVNDGIYRITEEGARRIGKTLGTNP